MEGSSPAAAILPPCSWSIDELTAEEKQCIASMRKEDPVLTAALTDHELALFALGRKRDVQRALTLLRANNEWRKEYKVERERNKESEREKRKKCYMCFCLLLLFLFFSFLFFFFFFFFFLFPFGFFNLIIFPRLTTCPRSNSVRSRAF